MVQNAANCFPIGANALQALFAGKENQAPRARDRDEDVDVDVDVDGTAFGVDLGERMTAMIGTSGVVQQAMCGFRIKVSQPAAFPFDRVFTALLSRDFKLHLTRRNGGLLIEARP